MCIAGVCFELTDLYTYYSRFFAMKWMSDVMFECLALNGFSSALCQYIALSTYLYILSLYLSCSDSGRDFIPS